MLLGGITGVGKSVALTTILKSAIKYYTEDDLNLILIDPKLVELDEFEEESHTKAYVAESSEAISFLEQAVSIMGDRYSKFREGRRILMQKGDNEYADVNNLYGYNEQERRRI